MSTTIRKIGSFLQNRRSAALVLGIAFTMLLSMTIQVSNAHPITGKSGAFGPSTPVVAHHPTSPVSIQAVRNLNVEQPGFWREVEIDVRNDSPQTVTNIVAQLGFVLPEMSNAVLYSSKTELLPHQTTTLKCSPPTNLPNKALDPVFQEAADKAMKSYVRIDSVAFKDFMWIRGHYARPSGFASTGQPMMQMDKALEIQMLQKMNIKPDWEQSEELQRYIQLITPDAVSTTSGGGCIYELTGILTPRCGRCSGTIFSELVTPCTNKPCYRLNIVTVSCAGGCFAQTGETLVCGPNTN